ncbi:permease prefix domain 1-containing protein [Ornithinibacillus contaminans]|uniref:permease prefix domain 1-containing protein n=1 Tax=Ornithinibacillus contaminans TaxID=694055 RepID=UPI00064DFBAE|nr:permease prefix domain 1-containing protein [Ornithinibacillus contaminans]
MNKLRKHVNELFKGIPDSEKKEKIIHEVLQNLEEKVMDLMEQGKAEEDAINKAIVDFGDIEDLKQELDVPQPTGKGMHKINLAYSIWGSILIIALFMFINFYYTPNVIWFVYPTFAVLWWPLTMYFRWMKRR